METLCAFDETKLPLRHLEGYTGLAIRSVQLALNGLVNENAVLKSRRGRNVCYSLNPNFEPVSLLVKVFSLVRADNIENRSRVFSDKARRSLEFSSEILLLTQKGKIKK